MEVIAKLKNVKGLDDYVSITEDMLKNIANVTLKLNNIGAVVDTVRVLKSIQSIEVQYFNTYNKCGAASIIFELLLGVPALEKDSALGKELVNVLEYWLSRVRKFLIHKNEHWWKLLRNLLDFIQKLYVKHPMIVVCLVKYTGECLLDLATQRKSSTEQRYQILQCFNLYSRTAPRELRNMMKEKYDVYFTKLAAWLPRCGDAVVQSAALEALLRWLLPRHERRARRDAAARWLPPALYPPRAVQLFLDCTWLNFGGNARLFLNALNEESDSVVSVLVEKFSVGSLSLLSVNTSRQHWLDLNTGTRSVSMMIDSVLCKTLSVANAAESDALFITEANTTSAQMYSGPRGTIILLKVIDPLQIFPAKVLENKNQVKVLSSNTDVQKIDKALKTIFATKYELMKNDDTTFMELLSQNSNTSRIMDYISEEETRFSNPPEILRRKLLEQRAAAEQSSSESSASCPMLAKKLKHLPVLEFDKELRIYATQNLETVPEISENSSHSFLSKHSGTDNSEPNLKNGSQNTEEGKDENDNNAIFNNKNLIELLANEALVYSRTNAVKNTQNQHSDDTREYNNFSHVNTRPRRCDKREYTVRDTIATDDSNTAFVENTPTINTNTIIRTKNRTFMSIDKDIYSKVSCFDKDTFNNEAVESFLSEHIAQDGNGNVNSSPILARKLNDSNSGSQSAAFIPCPPRPPQTEALPNFNYQEVEDCLNFVVNDVCENLLHLSQNSNQSNNSLQKSEIETGPRNTRLKEATNLMEKDKKISSNSKTKAIAKTTPVVKLRHKNIEKQTKTIKKNNKLGLNSREKKSLIFEKEKERWDLDKTTTADHLETPLSKRKRKLYSKKDDDLINKRTGVHVSETEEDNSNLTSKPADKSLVFTATPYKEIETIRKNAAMRLRKRESEVVSPKTKIANNLFDQLKNTVENNEKITLVEKGAVYNFSSSSEDDENFRKRTVVPDNTISVKSRRVKRDRNKLTVTSKDDSSRDTQINKQIAKKQVTAEPIRELIDERMREATTEVLNTSLINEYHTEVINTELQPAHKIPRMEIIPDDKECEIVTAPVMKNTKRQTKNTAKRAKRGQKTAKNKLVITDKADDDSKTISPLPGLEIEIQRINEPDESIVKLAKLNNKCEGDLVTLDFTKNLLSESEQVNSSPPRLNISDELIEPIVRPSNDFAVIDNVKVRSLTSSPASKSPNKQLVVVLDRLDIHSLKSISTLGKSMSNMGKSISTVGKCPITAHGEMDESPPQIEEIDRTILPRDLITEEFEADIIDFYNRLVNDVNVSPNKRNSKASELPKKSNSSPDTASNKSSDVKIQKSPSVCIRRLSQSEIEPYILHSRNLVFDSASTFRRSESSIPTSNKEPMNDKTTRVRKSIIAPIVFDETIFNKKSASPREDRTGVNTCEPDKSQCSPNRYDLRRFGKTDNVKNKTQNLPKILEDSKKKEGHEGSTGAAKKRKIEKEENTTANCEPLSSGSSVVDWFLRNENARDTQSCGEELKDELHNILEKLDTTLYENRQHVRSSLAKVMAQIRSRLEAKANERQEFLQMVMNLYRTIKERDEKLFEAYQTQIEVIFNDWVRKESDLVSLIKEDMQAAINRTKNKDV